MNKYIVSFSGGKDSTCMLLKLIELDKPIDEIIFCDTTLEFPEMYEYINKIEKHINRKITVLKPKKSFDQWFFGHYVRGKLKGKNRGFPLTVYKCYWSRESKQYPFDRYVKEKYPNDNVIRYLGINYDEPKRIHIKKGYSYPLYEYRIGNEEIIEYLLDKNLLNPLYNNFKRTGCYLCPKQSKKNMIILKNKYPLLFNKILWYNNFSIHGFSCNYNIKEL